jgi:dTDP-4-dehydrorhamnose reductase
MKYLILGSNGMAGHIVYLYLKSQGHEVDGFARTNQYQFDNIIIGDAMDTVYLEKQITNGDYDVVVNCIGILNDFAEKNKSIATFLNAYLPQFLADITRLSKTRIFHISTDCVFSGKRGSYKETDFRDGATFYDRSKALGELEDNKNLTLRNSIIGPDMNPKGIGLLNWFMQQHGTINGFTKSIWTGQTTLQLAKTIEKAGIENVTGLYNMVPDSSVSKYDLLLMLNQSFRNQALEIKPVEGIVADKSLVRTKFEFDYVIPNYETMIAELFNWVIKHKTLYPHYQL